MDDCTPLKRCTKCGQDLPRDQYNRHKRSKDGLRSECRSCQAQYYANHRVTMLNYQHDYRVSHYAEVVQHQKEYAETHHNETIARVRKWQKANPEKERARRAHRRARAKQAEGAYNSSDIAAQYRRQRGRCYYCHKKAERDGKSYHVEHVIPLDRGGSNGPENIVIACHRCNESKNNKLPHEWPKGGRLL